jgi:predicted type IV restriction endonuclease
MIGLMARCKKCNNVFNVEQLIESPKPVDLETTDATSDTSTCGESNDQMRRRRSPKEIMAEQIACLTKNVNLYIPKLNLAFKKQENESNTRILIDHMLQEILGYSLDDIKTEQKIEGRRADYVLSAGGNDVIVIEAKRIGIQLRDSQMFQATSYAAYSGIKWAVLTNAMVWQVFHISTGEKIETDLIFTIDLMDGLSEDEALNFYMIAKQGIVRKNLLEDSWRRIRALSFESIVAAVMSEEVISKIRKVLSVQTGYKVNDDELRTSLEENLLHL